MDRRGFFKLFGIGVAGIALEQAIPLGRVWSFPKEIVLPNFMSGVIGRCYGFDYLEVGDVISFNTINHPPSRNYKIVNVVKTHGLDVEWELTAADLRPSALKTS